MISGAMGLGMRDYLKAKRDEYRREVLAKAKLFIDNKENVPSWNTNRG